LRAGNKHEKEYIVTVDKIISKEFLINMASGVPILGTKTKKCKVVKISKYRFKIILIQGLNRQIRRMCEYFDYKVKKLVRVRIMHVNLTNLPVGKWRMLTKSEIKKLFLATAHSKKEHNKKRDDLKRSF